MSFPLVGNDASVTSWVGTFNAIMLAKLTDTDLDFDGDVEGQDVTGSNVGSFVLIPGEKSFTSKLTGFLLDEAAGNKVIGSLGDVSLAAGYTDILKRVKFTLETVATHDITEMRVNPEFKEFRPDTVIRGIFEYDCLVAEGVSQGDLPAIGDSGVATTLTYATGTGGATPKTIAGNAQILGRRFSMPKDGLQLVSYRGTFDGDMTAAGANAFFPVGVFVTPTWNDGVNNPIFTFNTGGSVDQEWAVSAFWNRITLSWEVGQAATAEIDLMPSGALTKT